MWLELSFEPGFSHLNNFLEDRKKMALNKYGLTAFYLHPTYQQEKLHFLSDDHVKEIITFLIDELKESYEDVLLFTQKKSIFKRL